MLKRFKTVTPQTRCYLNSSIILLLGWASAIIIFLTTEDIAENPLAEFENTKSYVNSVERMGGKTALLANELSKWFSGLWHGESLAFTVGFFTLTLAIGYYVIASSNLEVENENIRA